MTSLPVKANLFKRITKIFVDREYVTEWEAFRSNTFSFTSDEIQIAYFVYQEARREHNFVRVILPLLFVAIITSNILNAMQSIQIEFLRMFLVIFSFAYALRIMIRGMFHDVAWLNLWQNAQKRMGNS